MAKAAIRKLKADRFWLWMLCEVYRKPRPSNTTKSIPSSNVGIRSGCVCHAKSDGCLTGDARNLLIMLFGR